MKRYQCIKDFYVSDIIGLPDKRGHVCFTKGHLYNSDADGEKIIDGLGQEHDITLRLLDHFQELFDLHVDDIPRDEADREPFTTPEPRRKLTVGWAWFIALVITIGFFILKAFTE